MRTAKNSNPERVWEFKLILLGKLLGKFYSKDAVPSSQRICAISYKLLKGILGAIVGSILTTELH